MPDSMCEVLNFWLSEYSKGISKGYRYFGYGHITQNSILYNCSFTKNTFCSINSPRTTSSNFTIYVSGTQDSLTGNTRFVNKHLDT